MKFLSRLLPLSLFAPMLALASDFSEISTFFQSLTNLMSTVLVPAVFAFAVLMFLWGVVNTFILGGGDEEKQKKGKQLMLYSIAGFVLMVSLWGIVNVFSNFFGVDDRNTYTPPAVPSFGTSNTD